MSCDLISCLEQWRSGLKVRPRSSSRVNEADSLWLVLGRPDSEAVRLYVPPLFVVNVGTGLEVLWRGRSVGLTSSRVGGVDVLPCWQPCAEVYRPGTRCWEDGEDTAGDGLLVEERLLQSVKLQDDNSGRKSNRSSSSCRQDRGNRVRIHSKEKTNNYYTLISGLNKVFSQIQIRKKINSCCFDCIELITYTLY